MQRRRGGLELVLVGIVIAMMAVAWDFDNAAEHSGAPDHHEGTAHTARDPAAIPLIVLGTLVAGVGTGLHVIGKPPTRVAYALFTASYLMLADGVVHFYAVSDHVSIPLFGAFFAAVGAAQLGLAVGLWRAKPLVYLVSGALMAGLIVLFFVTRFISPPGMAEPEAFEPLGILSKVLEFAALGALVYLVLRWRSGARLATRSAVSEPAQG